MPKTGALVFVILIGLVRAQDGQQGSRPGWPCVAGLPMDPTYLDVSESTGGQLFLFQKSEVAHSSVVMSASYTHPATVLRAVGNVSGTRDFEFPVDSSMESLLVMASLQCRNAILVNRPNGAELTAANSAQLIDLQAGRIHRIDSPEPGLWRVRLTGTGVFVLSVLAKTKISLSGVGFSTFNNDAEEPVRRASLLKEPLLEVPQTLMAHLGGEVSNVRFQVVDASGDPILDLDPPELTAPGTYWTTVKVAAERFRIRVMGTDATAWPFQRTHPILFRAQRPK